MSLQRGFLRKTPAINTSFLATALLLGFATSLSLYGIFSGVREAFRLSGSVLGERHFLALTDHQKFIYSLFFATTSVCLGYLFALRFVLENSILRNSRKNRFRLRNALNYQGFFTWIFLLCFSRLLLALAINYGSSPIEYELDFIEDLSLLLILIPIVLFLSPWPELIKVFRRKGIQWMGISFLAVFALSFGLSFIRIPSWSRTERILTEACIECSGDFEIPRARYDDHRYRRSPNTYNLFVTLQDQEIKMFWENRLHPTSFAELGRGLWVNIKHNPNGRNH